MDKKQMRVGLIGAGAIVAQRHLPGGVADGAVEIVAIANTTRESAERFCRNHHLQAEVCGDWKEVVARRDVDVIWIGTTPYMHAEITERALEEGKHVFCQARMARNLSEARRMEEASRRHPELVTMLCPPPMGLTGDAFIHHLLKEGTLGKIRHVRLQSFNGGLRDASAPAHWRQRKEISGENILTLGIYVEVLQRWLGRIAKLSASGRVFIPERAGYRVEIPDALDVICKWEHGALGCLQWSGVYGGTPTERLEIDGEKGVLVYDFLADSISLNEGGKVTPLPIPEALLGGWRVEADFLHAVRNPSEPRPHPDFQDGVAYMAVVQAVADALATGREVVVC